MISSDGKILIIILNRYFLSAYRKKWTQSSFSPPYIIKKKIRNQFLAKHSSEYVLLTGVVYYISHAQSVGM